MTLAALTLHDAGEKLRRRELTSVALTEAAFERIAETDNKVRAYLTLDRDVALASARRADERLRKAATTIRRCWESPLHSKIIF